MRRLRLFFDKESLLKILSQYTEVWNLLEGDLDLWLGFHESEFNAIHKAIEGNEWANKVLKVLINNNNQTNIQRYHEPLDLDDFDLDIENPHTLFFVNASDEDCLKWESQFGLIFLNFERYVKYKDKLFSTFIFNVTKRSTARNRLIRWNELGKLNQPCNGVILIDNYILKDEKDIVSNLLPLLEQILPKNWTSTNRKIDLTILTDTEKMSGVQISNHIQAIENHFKPISLNISVVKVSGVDVHDRNIITNSLWYHSGHSFTYFNDKGDIKKQTTLFVYPIWHLQRTIDKATDYDKTAFWAMVSLLEEVESIVNKTVDIGVLQYVWGNKKNRLL